MRSTRTIVFGCALIAVALVFWGILRAIRSSNAPAPAVATTTAAPGTPGALNVSAPSAGKIALAATDIPAGSIVTDDMLEMKDYSGPTTAPFITDVDKQAAGFITRVAIPKGSQIRPEDDFIGHISQTGIAGALRPGTRALVLPLPGKPTLHDLVKIGNSVDIIAAFDGQESRTIVENVRVLAVDVFANDFPQVNAAMSGPYKADKPGSKSASASARANTAPGASGSQAGAPPDSIAPDQQPTPRPDKLPPLDPALTLEVTPQQAAAIQLAQASQAPLDFLLRPALPGNRSGEVTLVNDNGTPGAEGAAQPIVNSVTKRQLAPYAEAIKNRKAAGGNAGGGNAGNGSGRADGGGSAGGSGSGGTRTVSTRGDRPSRLPMPDFPDVTTMTTPSTEVPSTPFNPANAKSNANSNGEFGGGDNGNGNSGERLAPRAPSTYQIPIYSDGGVVRTETVPVPIR